MSIESQNNKRIAKNTIILYFRMIITTLVSLYTARLMLQLLGVEDFGIYNVVGGIIGFMAIITGTMTSATMRFLAYDLGKKDINQYRRTFSMLINMFFVFCLMTIVLMEIIGPYFIAEHLVIPDDRQFAAQWIFQYTIVTFCFTTMEIPFTASIVSYEKMNIYAYFAFIDVGLKLLSVLVLYITPIDKLITYGTIIMLGSILKTSIMFIYCLRKLDGCNYIKYWDKTLFKKMSSYTGWNLFGSTTGVLNNQGQAILLNLFFGPLVNASKAIADKINSIIYSFSQNFFMAVNPQIIKAYASGDFDYTRKLVIKSIRMSSMIFWGLSFPIIYHMKDILIIWLGREQVSHETVLFSQLTLLLSITSCYETPITQTVRATGNIKKYQIVIGVQTLLFAPICFIAFKLGAPAYSSLIVLIIIYSLTIFSRSLFLRKILNVNLIGFMKETVLSFLIIMALSIFILYILNNFVYGESWIANLVFDFIIQFGIIILWGLNNKERKYIANLIKIKRNA